MYARVGHRVSIEYHCISNFLSPSKCHLLSNLSSRFTFVTQRTTWSIIVWVTFTLQVACTFGRYVTLLASVYSITTTRILYSNPEKPPFSLNFQNFLLRIKLVEFLRHCLEKNISIYICVIKWCKRYRQWVKFQDSFLSTLTLQIILILIYDHVIVLI